MRQTYGDKQREAQQRKKQEELWKKSNPAPDPGSETTEGVKPDQPATKKPKKSKRGS